MTSKKNKIKVSIIVPMFNVDGLIASTVGSLMMNSCSLEVLLINDGSTDDTLNAAINAVNGDSRFKIINKKNSGVSATRNFGLARARGEYITFVDSDDLIPDGAIDQLYHAAVDRNADCVYGEVKRFNSKKTWVVAAHEKFKTFEPGYKNIKDNPEIFYSIGPAGKLIHKRLLRNNRFPVGIKFGEDQAVSFNVYLNANKIYCIDTCVYLYRERDLDVSAPSATQMKDVRSFLYLQNILYVVINNKNSILEAKWHTDDKYEILKGYYERVINHEIWPLFIRTLKYDKENISNAVQAITQFMINHPAHFIDKVPAFRYFFLRVLIDHVFYLKLRNFNEYRYLLNCLLDCLDEETKVFCAKKNVYGRRWSDNIYLAQEPYINALIYFIYLSKKKRINSYINKNKENIIQKYLLPIFNLLPRDKNKIIFATSKRGKVSPNFEFMLNSLKRTKKTFEIKKFLGVSDSIKRKVYRYYHLATAGTIFVEDYYRPLYGIRLRKKTKVVQIWHACGAFKKFGFSAISHNDSNTYDFEAAAHKVYTHVLSSSPVTSRHYSEAFGRKNFQLLETGIPRTDLFFDEVRKANTITDILLRYPLLKNSTCILYAPTFRGSPTQRNTFHIPFEWSVLDSMPFGHTLVIKLHPVVDVSTINVPEKYKNRVLVLSGEEDVNKWMIFCDVLVTDYSSLIFEYSLLDKPLILYPFDLEDYFDERGFYYPYEEYAFGPIVRNDVELLSAILDSNTSHLIYSDKRQQFREKFMKNCTGKSTLNIIKNIITN